jgi:hypothetical protein
MLWYKSWFDTRWRFLITLFVLMVNVWGLLFEYPRVADLLRTVQLQPDVLSQTGALGRAILESVTAERTYRGYVWYQWFRNNLSQLGTLVAVLLGSGNILSGSTGAGTLFTLSLPRSRDAWVAARAAVGLGELLALIGIPSLEIMVVSALIGQQYALSDVAVHVLCTFVVCAVFFSLAVLLSTMFADLWRPFLIAGGSAIVVSLIESRFALNGPYRVMSAATYFAAGAIPWVGLVFSAVIAAGLLYGAAVNLSRHDF